VFIVVCHLLSDARGPAVGLLSPGSGGPGSMLDFKVNLSGWHRHLPDVKHRINGFLEIVSDDVAVTGH
jgi:hypothetical protein